MRLRTPVLVSAMCLGVMTVAGIYARQRVPATIAVHWNMAGSADGHAPRDIGLIIVPLIAIGISLFLWILPAITPRSASLEDRHSPYSTIWSATIVLLTFAQLLIIDKNLGATFDIARPILIAVGALISLIGNYLSKLRWNARFGLRNPWTLRSDSIWDATHRFAGRAMFAAGVSLVVATLVAPTGPQGDSALGWVLVLAACVPPIAAHIYSAHLGRRSSGPSAS